MHILIVGSGCSAIYLSCLITYYKKDIDVDILDILNNPGKKFLVTGNGRCNLGNLKPLDNHSYNDYMSKYIVENCNISNIIDFFKNIGIDVGYIDNLVYPHSFSSKNFKDNLINYLSTNKRIKYINDKIIDYKSLKDGINVKFKDSIKRYDKVVFASGGNSGNNENSMEIWRILDKHEYHIAKLRPGLCPIVTRENINNLNGKRLKCKVILLKDKFSIYSEVGEVLLKKDGLSGIAIFNCASIINRHIEDHEFVIKLDLFDEYSEFELENKLKIFNKNNTISLLNSFFEEEISNYIYKILKFDKKSNFNDEEIRRLARKLKNLRFTFKKTYDFKDSQVTIGGVPYSDLKEKELISTLESKTEKNIYFIGEILDSDGLCGGYNLMFAFASAYQVFKNL